MNKDDNAKKYTDEEINELIKQFQNGDQSAFSPLYDHFAPGVHKRVWHMVPHQDVEDVTQEVFIAVTKSLKSFKGNSKFSTWLWTITNRQIANYYRKKERYKDEQQMDEFPDNIAVTKSKTKQQDDFLTIKEGLSALPENYQEVLLLRFAEGLRFHEIAEEIDKTVDATKSLFRRAVEALRKEIGETSD